MALMLQQMAEALVKTADLIEEADREAAGFFEITEDIRDGALGEFAPHSSDPNPDFDGVDGSANYTDGPVNGQPFIPGVPAIALQHIPEEHWFANDATAIHPSDIDQGGLGDCYLMSSLAALARTEEGRASIANMIRYDEAKGVYVVTLYKRPGPFGSQYEPVEIELTPEFPLRADGTPAFAGSGDAVGGQVELWPMLIEKAYAKHHGGYDEVEGGWGNIAMEELTGVPSEKFSPSDMDIDQLSDRFDAGDAITVSSIVNLKIKNEKLGIDWDIPDASDTNPLFQNGTLCPNHEYYITNVDRAAGVISIRNPWGWDRDEIHLAFAEFQDAFRRASVNSLGP